MIEYFDGDRLIANEILKLKNKHNIKIAFETGVYLGKTTKWFSENFEKVFAFEINNDYIQQAKNYCNNDNINYILGNSADTLQEIVDTVEEPSIFYLDAHWGDSCPTPKELEIISTMKIKPIIVIHDFYVPEKGHPEGLHNQGHPGWGWDYYPGFKYKWEYIETYINSIYGENGYEYFYNSEVEGARRGVIYIEPKIKN